MPSRSFTSPAGCNAKFAGWLDGANRRAVCTIKARPTDLVDADRDAVLALPPDPLRVGWFNRVRPGRDYDAPIDSNDHSVDPTAIGRQVTSTADLHRVQVRFHRRRLADHARVWARHTTVTDPARVEIAPGCARSSGARELATTRR